MLLKPNRKLKVSNEEEEYIISKLSCRILDFHSILETVAQYVKAVGGMNKIINDSSNSTHNIKIVTVLSGGDFQQLLQEYRRLNPDNEKRYS